MTVSQETGNPDFFQATDETREVTQRGLNTVALLNKCYGAAIHGYCGQRIEIHSQSTVSSIKTSKYSSYVRYFMQKLLLPEII